MYNGSDNHLKNTLAARKLALAATQINKQLRIDEYNLNPSYCTHCNRAITYSKRNNQFCNQSCSASYNNTGRTHSIESKIKRKRAMRTGGDLEYAIKCKHDLCDITFCNYNRIRYCSDNCKKSQQKINRARPEVLAKQSATKKQMWLDGKLKGWAKRSNLKPSYPEQHFINFFNDNKIFFKREVKKGRFFCDFMWEDKMLVLEVDGSQHSRADYVLSDARKDQYLQSLGYTVFRIQWFNPISELHKNKLYPQINDFMDMYRKFN